jgi:hypothetical protein
MAGRTQIALRIGLHPMLAKEVPVVNEMAFGRGAFRCQLHVATIAVAHVPLAGVLMAAEASCHVGAQRGVFKGHVDVAAHAISCPALGVRGVRKSQVLTRHLCRVTSSRSSVAIRAGVGIVRVLVATDAVFRRGQMKRTGLTGLLNARMTLVAVDPFEHVGAMLKRTLWALVLTLEPENLGAGSRRASQGYACDDCDQPLGHFFGH